MPYRHFSRNAVIAVHNLGERLRQSGVRACDGQDIDSLFDAQDRNARDYTPSTVFQVECDRCNAMMRRGTFYNDEPRSSRTGWLGKRHEARSPCRTRT